MPLNATSAHPISTYHIYDSAIIHNIQAIALYPKSIVAVNNLSGIYYSRQQYREAIDVCERSIRYSPDNIIAYANIAISYQKMGKYDSAIYYSNKGIVIKPDFNGSYEILASAYKAAGNLDSARRYETIAQKNNPGFRLQY